MQNDGQKQEIEDAEFKDLNTLAYKEFLDLLNDSKVVPEEWKLLFKDQSLASHDTVISNIEKMPISGETENVANKTT